jgi:hypothetical protein
MKVLKKALVGIGVAALLIGSGQGVSAKSYEIDSMKELKDAIVELNSLESESSKSRLNSLAPNSSKESNIDKKREDIIASTDPNVLNNYNEKLQEDFEAIEDDINNSQPEIDSTKTFDLPSTGGKVDVTVSNTLIKADPKVEGVMSLARIQQPFGSYNYQVQYRVYHVLYPDAWAVLNTFYKTASNGLTATSSSKAGSQGLFPAQVSGSTRITDSRAEKLGYDINAQGDYTITYIGANGVGILHYDITLISRVKWVAQGSTSSYVERSYTKY